MKKQKDNLSFYTTTRNTLEGVLKKVMEEITEDKRKKIISEGLGQLSIDIVAELTDCMVNCEPCDSCAVDLLKNIIKKLQNYNRQNANKENVEAAIEAERKDLIDMIEANDGSVRNILRDKTRGSTISKCDQDKMDVWDKVK